MKHLNAPFAGFAIAMALIGLAPSASAGPVAECADVGEVVVVNPQGCIDVARDHLQLNWVLDAVGCLDAVDGTPLREHIKCHWEGLP